jgi:asparagine synthase (glutamine-hydrolysing)
MPVRLKIQSGNTKYILKKVAAQLLPEQIWRRRKQGFAVPIGRWFQQGILAPNLKRLPPFINAGEVARRFHLHRDGRSDERLFLWAVLMLEKSLAREA